MAEVRDILETRKSTHGDYSDHARVTQNIKSVMHDSPNWNRLSADKTETLEMIAHKIGRILSGNPDFADHWDDIAGYATLSSDRVNGEKK